MLNNLNVNLLLDLALMGLLVATVVYCFVLNRRLKVLRDARGDMAGMIREFHQATEAARAGVGELKTASDAIGGELQEHLQSGRTMLDELEVVLASAERVAGRIEKGVENTRAGDPTGGKPELRPLKGGRGDDGRTDAERELLQALREVR